MQKSDPGSQTEKLVPLFRGVAAGATRRGHAEVACGGEEALLVLLADPQGHTAALAETTIGAQCHGQASCPVGGTVHIVDGRGREGHCTRALVRVRHLRRHGSGARQNRCGLAAVDTVGAHLSVEAGAVIQACRRQQEVLWTQHKFGIADARVINVDETSLRMIPVSATGWSVKGEKTKQVQASKSNMTATLAVPMLQGPSFCQLIFGGKTSAVLPHGSVEHDVHLSFTESHWQSTESMFSFVQFLEKVLNPTDEQRPWILLLDCASVHTASAFRQQLHSQLPWVKSIYIHGGSTAYNQPLDRSTMKSFKSAIARKASRHFAEQILLVDSLDLSARFLKPVIATWVHEVMNDISSRRDIFQTAWAHILPKNPEHAASILLAAGESARGRKSLQIEQGGRRTRDSTGR